MIQTDSPEEQPEAGNNRKTSPTSANNSPLSSVCGPKNLKAVKSKTDSEASDTDILQKPSDKAITPLPLPRSKAGKALQRFLDPDTWASREGKTAAAMQMFFKVFSGAKLPWVMGAGSSFAARIGIAHVLSMATDSRLITGAALWGGGVLIAWPISYTLQRWNHLKQCKQEDGTLNAEKWKDLRKHAIYYLAVQEAGYFACYGAAVSGVMLASFKIPVLYGALGGALSSVAANGLQWSWQNFLHDKATPFVRKLFKSIGSDRK